MKNIGQDIRSFASQVQDSQLLNEPQGGYTIVLDPVGRPGENGQDAPPPPSPDKETPPKILEMVRMYQYGGSAFEQRCRNFYRQGKFMEDYEDDAPWEGEFSRYFPTYHDLNIRQLRGYFTWRTQVRKGVFRPIATSMAYIYLYELLNGIGTSSVEESLWKMQEFETEFLDSDIGDPRMRRNLRRWMLELAIIHKLPQKTVIQYAEPLVLELDRRLEILRDPENRTDEELFQTLSRFSDRNLEASPVFLSDAAAARHLFTEVWRHASAHCRLDGQDLLTACFGPQKAYHWYPLGNAVYLERRTLPEITYELTGCRRFLFRGGHWMEEKHDELHFDRKRIKSLLHVTDLMLRRYLKTGRYLRENAEETWAVPFVEAVIEADRQAKIEAARPKVNINLDSLQQIRDDAVVTRDSLLTDEELAESAATEATVTPAPATTAESGWSDIALDDTHKRILTALLEGKPVDELVRAHKLLPAVVTDTINEAFFDEIGDSILDCDGDRIRLVEDYEEDVKALAGATCHNL